MPPIGDHVIIANDPRIIAETWKAFKPLFAMFVSSTQADAVQDNAHIANTVDGYWLELQKCGQADTLMGTQELQVSPYSTRLRPVRDISGFSSYSEIFLTRAIYQALDGTLTGNPDQDASVLAEIENSLMSSNDAYVQSRFLNGEIGAWQPNFFFPYLAMKSGTNIFSSLGMSNFETKSNKGDLSMGVMLPYEYTPPLPVYLGKLANAKDSLEVFCGCGQLINDGGTMKVQRYPVVAFFEFLALQ